MIDEDSAHGDRGDGKEVISIVVLGSGLIHELQVRMNDVLHVDVIAHKSSVAADDGPLLIEKTSNRPRY